MCLAGQLDTYRASIIADAARHALDDLVEFLILAERITTWLRQAIVTGEGRPALVNRTVKQVRNKAN